MSVASRLLFERGGLIGMLALAFYTWNAPSTFVDNDNTEFSTLGAIGGGAHPSGYPLYVLYLRLWSWLPGSAVHDASIGTAVLGAVAIVVLHAACRAWGARPSAATLACAIVAAAPLIARYHSEAEAFALNHVVVALVLWLAATAGPLRGGRRVFALGLVAGLGLANHLTCALVAPIGLLGVVRGIRESSPRASVLAIAGLALGLLPYAYLFVAPENLLAWPRPTSASELLDIATRRAYGGTFGFSGAEAEVDHAAQLAELVRSIGRSWLWVLPLLAVVTWIRRIAKPGSGETRLAWGVLAATFVIAGPLLALRFDTPVDWYGLVVVRRFHLVPILLLAIPIAVGFELLVERVRPRYLHAATAGVFVVLAFATLPYLDRAHSPALELAVRNTLRTLPPHAVVLGTVNELDVGARYLQLTEDVRPDVVVRWQSLSLPWYRARFEPGIHWQPGDTLVQLVERLHAEGRPVFVNPGEVDALSAFANHRYGVLVRLLPRGTPAPSNAEVFAQNRELFAQFDLAYPRPSPGDEFAASMHERYASTWTRLARLLARDHEDELAAQAQAIAEQLAPQ